MLEEDDKRYSENREEREVSRRNRSSERSSRKHRRSDSRDRKSRDRRRDDSRELYSRDRSEEPSKRKDERRRRDRDSTERDRRRRDPESIDRKSRDRNVESSERKGRDRDVENSERKSRDRGRESKRDKSKADSSFADETKNREKNDEKGEKKKKRVSRFSAENEKVTIPGMPLNVTADMDEGQRRCYLLQVRIEEISMKLRTGNIGLYDYSNRSPSPEPIYDSMGVRINTREMRLRTRLEEERDNLIAEVLLMNPDYKPPLEIRPNTSKITDRVFIPQDANPNVNFIGLLIGPRGNTLKRLEQDSGCKIIIRGKGSLKDGKMRTMPLPGEDEPLHALLTANCEEDIRKGRQIVQKIINDCVSNPTGENELRKMQLRELAVLNGTLVASEISKCKNCGATDHRHWECTQAQNFTNLIVCEKCGGGGHLSFDCIYDGETAQTAEEKSKLDSAYKELMTELGVKNEPIGGSLSGIMTTRNVPSILALPKIVVAQLPWASAGAGLVANTPGSAAPLALPAPDPAYSVAMNYRPAGLAESFGVSTGSFPMMPPPSTNMGWSQGTSSNNQAMPPYQYNQNH